MKYYAIVIGDTVDSIAAADYPLGDLGQWIDVTDITPRPGPGWKYVDGVFDSQLPTVPVVEEPTANT